MGSFIPIKGAKVDDSERMAKKRVMKEGSSRRVSEARASGQGGRLPAPKADRRVAPFLRDSETAEMLALYTDVRRPMSFRQIADEMNRRHEADGIEVRYSADMVRRDLGEALALMRSRSEEDVARCFGMAQAEFINIIRNGIADYEGSKRADAKTEASLLRTLIKDAGMTYDDAMDQIEARRYTGNPDHQRVVMEAFDRLLGLMGVSTKAAAASGPSQQAGGNIVNYNFQSVGMEKMKRIVKAIQDGKFKEVSGGVPARGEEEA